MRKKTVELLWGICLAILGIFTIVICMSSLSEMKLDSAIVKALGIIEVIIMPCTVYLTAKLVKLNKVHEEADTDTSEDEPSEEE